MKTFTHSSVFDHHEPTMGDRSRGGNPDLNPKSRPGFLNIPAHQDYRVSGSPDLLDQSGFWSVFLRLIETRRDWKNRGSRGNGGSHGSRGVVEVEEVEEVKKVEEVEKC